MMSALCWTNNIDLIYDKYILFYKILEIKNNNFSSQNYVKK